MHLVGKIYFYRFESNLVWPILSYYAEDKRWVSKMSANAGTSPVDRDHPAIFVGKTYNDRYGAYLVNDKVLGIEYQYMEEYYAYI